jgi:hypothetical protein
VGAMGGKVRTVGRLAMMTSLTALVGCGGGSVNPRDAGIDRTTGAGGGGACEGVWTRESTAQSPPGVWHAAMAPDPDRGEVLLFGGILAEPQGRSNQAWSWNGATATWTNRTPTPLPLSWPAALSNHRMVWDPVRRRILMFGGTDNSLTALADLWEWNGAAGTWTNLSPTQFPNAWPARRESPAMAYDAARGRLMVVSGYAPTNAVAVLDDVWEQNSTDGTWTDRTPDPRPAEWFEARQYPSMAIDPSSGRAVLLGGFSGSGSLRDEMWEWNAATATWTDLKALPRPGSWPPGGSWAALTDGPCPGKLIAVGTDLLIEDPPNSDIVQIWRWDGATRDWTDLAPSPRPAAWPPAGQTPAAAPDPVTGRIVFFGGQPRPAGVPSNETWTWGPAR